MSTIAEITIHTGRIPLVRTFTTAVRSTQAIDVAVVEVRDADGVSGFGEATANWRVTGESLASVLAAIKGPLTEAIRGQHPAEVLRSGAIGRALAFNASAKSAVDCAIHDLLARREGKPLTEFLADFYLPVVGNSLRPKGFPSPVLTTDMTVSAGTPAQVVAAAESAADFGVIKIKVSDNPEQIAAVPAVRQALGAGPILRVDANQAWSVERAIAIIRGWEDAGIELEFVEQPTPAGDLLGLAQVAAAVRTPIIADESVRDRHDAELLAHLAPGIGVNLKLAKTGGLAHAMALAEAARNAGQPLMVGCMMESAVGITSAAALAALWAPDTTHDLDAGLWVESGPVDGGVEYAGERLVLSKNPGSGIRGLRGGWATT